MRRRLQFGMRENPASDRRHGSRKAVGSLSDGNFVDQRNSILGELASGQNQLSAKSADAASPPAATGRERDDDARHSAALVGPPLPEKALHGFEPLIGSCEAAKLLGDIHVKTLQRYARSRRVPGYQIGGHWYFRASELDSWLRSRINSSCHPCRSNQEAK